MDTIFFTDQLIPALNRGLVMSIKLIIPSGLIGLMLGIVIGTLRTFGHSAVRKAAMCSGAYHSEYIRGSLLSIKKGQFLAAQSMGFSTFKTMCSIIVPQAVRRALPGCGNEIIYLIKYSSLAYIITCIELTGEGKMIATRTFRYTEVFMVIGFYYLVLVTMASFVLQKLEVRLKIPGFGKA
jgi:polar amino acid transport system permease protein